MLEIADINSLLLSPIIKDFDDSLYWYFALIVYEEPSSVDPNLNNVPKSARMKSLRNKVTERCRSAVWIFCDKRSNFLRLCMLIYFIIKLGISFRYLTRSHRSSDCTVKWVCSSTFLSIWDWDLMFHVIFIQNTPLLVFMNTFFCSHLITLLPVQHVGLF